MDSQRSKNSVSHFLNSISIVQEFRFVVFEEYEAVMNRDSRNSFNRGCFNREEPIISKDITYPSAL